MVTGHAVAYGTPMRHFLPQAWRGPVFAPLFLALVLAPHALPAVAAEPIRIGVSGPFTGGSSPMGLSMRDGIRLAAREINEAGGVLGRPIVLVERDDEARPERGAAITHELITRERIVAGVGIVNTGVALASQRFYQDARVPVITAVATGSILTRQFLPPRYADNYVFRISASDTIQAEMIVRDAVDQRGLKRVAILHDTTNYGQLGRDDLEAALARRGVEPVTVQRFNIGDVDLSAQVLRAKTAGAEAVLTYGIGPELAYIANAMARLGWRVPLVGSWTLSMPNVIDQAGPNAEGARMPQTFIPDPRNPRHRVFLDAYRALSGASRIPVPCAAAQGYDGMKLMAAAIAQAGSTDGTRIRAALEDLRTPVEGLIATYVQPYSRTDHEAIETGVAPPAMGEVRFGEVRRAAAGATVHVP